MAPLAVEAGLFELARWGLEQARLVEPYSEALSRAAMEVAAAEGDADRLRLEWRECQRRVDALDPGSSPSPRTEELFGTLSRRVFTSLRHPMHQRIG
jgi:DNA-binding SARP family transcriptional activator